MPNAYLSPGVYVEEIPSSVQAIAGVGTSTAGFIGVVPDTVPIAEANPDYDPTLKRPKPAPPEKPVTVKGQKEGGPVPTGDIEKEQPKESAAP
jgi:phage tail sheath protein FI